jgi:CRP-like cAMP-binding protein
VLFFLDIASLVVVIAAWFAILFTGHEPGTDVYLVLDGVIRVKRDRERLAEYGPGALLGERASLERGVRTATLVWSQPAGWRRSTPGSWSAPPWRNCLPVTGGRDPTRLDRCGPRPSAVSADRPSVATLFLPGRWLYDPGLAGA